MLEGGCCWARTVEFSRASRRTERHIKVILVIKGRLLETAYWSEMIQAIASK
jgi:hypothetical protein